MDLRISTLETDVATVRAKVDAIHANYATKDELREAESRLHLKIETSKNELSLRIVEFGGSHDATLVQSHHGLDRKIDKVQFDLERKMEVVKSDLERHMEVFKFELERKMDALKADLERQTDGLKADLERRTDGLKVDVERQTDGLKVDLERRIDAASLEFHKLTVELRTWFLATALTMFIGFGGLGFGLYKALTP